MSGTGLMLDIENRPSRMTGGTWSVNESSAWNHDVYCHGCCSILWAAVIPSCCHSIIWVWGVRPAFLRNVPCCSPGGTRGVSGLRIIRRGSRSAFRRFPAHRGLRKRALWLAVWLLHGEPRLSLERRHAGVGSGRLGLRGSMRLCSSWNVTAVALLGKPGTCSLEWTWAFRECGWHESLWNGISALWNGVKWHLWKGPGPSGAGVGMPAWEGLGFSTVRLWLLSCESARHAGMESLGWRLHGNLLSGMQKVSASQRCGCGFSCRKGNSAYCLSGMGRSRPSGAVAGMYLWEGLGFSGTASRLSLSGRSRLWKGRHLWNGFSGMDALSASLRSGGGRNHNHNHDDNYNEAAA